MVPKFWDLLQGAKWAQSYDFSCMRAQFLLCQLAGFEKYSKLSKVERWEINAVGVGGGGIGLYYSGVVGATHTVRPYT